LAYAGGVSPVELHRGQRKGIGERRRGIVMNKNKLAVLLQALSKSVLGYELTDEEESIMKDIAECGAEYTLDMEEE